MSRRCGRLSKACWLSEVFRNFALGSTGQRKCEHIIKQLDIFKRRTPNYSRTSPFALVERPNSIASSKFDPNSKAERRTTVCAPRKFDGATLCSLGFAENASHIAHSGRLRQRFKAYLFFRFIHALTLVFRFQRLIKTTTG